MIGLATRLAACGLLVSATTFPRSQVRREEDVLLQRIENSYFRRDDIPQRRCFRFSRIFPIAHSCSRSRNDRRGRSRLELDPQLDCGCGFPQRNRSRLILGQQAQPTGRIIDISRKATLVSQHIRALAVMSEKRFRQGIQPGGLSGAFCSRPVRDRRPRWMFSETRSNPPCREHRTGSFAGYRRLSKIDFIADSVDGGVLQERVACPVSSSKSGWKNALASEIGSSKSRRRWRRRGIHR